MSVRTSLVRLARKFARTLDETQRLTLCVPEEDAGEGHGNAGAGFVYAVDTRPCRSNLANWMGEQIRKRGRLARPEKADRGLTEDLPGAVAVERFGGEVPQEHETIQSKADDGFFRIGEKSL